MTQRTRGWVGILVAVIMLWGSATIAPAQFRRGGREFAKNTDPVRSAFRDVVSVARASTVVVLSDGKAVALGAVVGADGWIVSKASELSEKPVVRLADGKELAARLVGTDDDHDLALLKVEAKGLKAVKWGDAPGMQVGQWVATVGDDPVPVAVGVLSVGRRKIAPRSAMLGIQMDDEASENDQEKTIGARVKQVLKDSGAEKAGVKDNDIIISFDGQEVASRLVLVEMIAQRRFGDTVPLVVLRAGEKVELKATLGLRSALVPDRGDQMNAMGGPLSRRNAGFETVLQHDTVLKPQDCGGPLVNLSGEVIAINIARGGRTESYAVPADVVQKVVEKLTEKALAAETPQGEQNVVEKARTGG